MPRQATGIIVEHRAKDGSTTRTLRFYVNGRREPNPLDAVSHDEAQRQLAYVLADVERGTWQTPKPAPPSPSEAPLFGDFADEWWKRRKGQLARKTQQDYRWRLEVHLLDTFENTPIDAITYDTVERFIAAKMAEGLSPRSVNMLVGLMAAILEGALERELIARNPAKGKARRVRERAPQRSYLSTAGQIRALLDAASELDGAKKAGARRRVRIRGALHEQLAAIRPEHVDPTPTCSATSRATGNTRRTCECVP